MSADALTSVAPIGDEDIWDFTNGTCGILAKHIADLTGWPVVLISDGVPLGDGFGWIHAGVRIPDGHILDVEGLCTEAEWVARWRPRADAQGVEDDLYDRAEVRVREPLGSDLDCIGDPHERAEEVAAILIAFV